MKFNLKNLLFNATFGDAHMAVKKTVITPTFISTSMQMLDLKERMMADCGIEVSRRGEQTSGYGGSKRIFNINPKGSKELLELYNSTSRKDLLSSAEDIDILILYLDDGSWHIRSELMHLYCNDLSEEEVTVLSKRITELYGEEPTLRYDKKKDGRSFPYFYFNRKLTNTVRDQWFNTVKELGITDMYYKFGGEGYVNYAGNKVDVSRIPEIRKDFEDGVDIQEMVHKYKLRYVTLDNILKGKTYVEY